MSEMPSYKQIRALVKGRVGKQLREEYKDGFASITLGNGEWEIHHLVPKYLQERLKKLTGGAWDVDDCPAIMLTRDEHWFPNGIHQSLKVAEVGFGPKVDNYTKAQILNGLKESFEDLGKPELWELVKQWLATKGVQ